MKIFSSENELVNQVYQTSNYDQFHINPSNRKVNDLQVRKLEKSLEVHGWEVGSYIVVNQHNEIIDGQHRWKAGRKLGIPFLFIRESKADLQTIRILNSNQKNWSTKDHLHGYAETGMEDYRKVINFMERYPDFSTSDVMCLVMNDYTVVRKEILESGNLKVKDMELAEEWAERLLALRPLFKEGYKMSSFIRSLVRVFNKVPDFNFEEFLEKVRQRPGNIYIAGSIKKYIEMIENIYNFNRKRGKIDLHLLYK